MSERLTDGAPVYECDPGCQRGVLLGWVVCLGRASRSSNIGSVFGGAALGYRRGLEMRNLLEVVEMARRSLLCSRSLSGLGWRRRPCPSRCRNWWPWCLSWSEGAGDCHSGKPITQKTIKSTSGHLRTHSRYPCSLTIDYEEQEQANKVSGGTSVRIPSTSLRLIICTSGSHQTDYAEG